MLYKLLFIIHIKVKSLFYFKVILHVVQEQSASVTKVDMAHAYLAFKFQVSMQINEILLYNKK